MGPDIQCAVEPLQIYRLIMVSLNTPLRILLVSRQFWPVAHGAETQMLRLAGALIREGHQVRALSARFEQEWSKQEILAGNVPLLRLPSPKTRGMGTVCFLSSLAMYLARHQSDYDIIHINTLKYAAALAALWGKTWGIPILARTLCAGPEGDMAHLQTLPSPYLVRKSLHRLDRVVALSSEIHDELLQNGFSPSQIVQIPNSIDEGRFVPPFRDLQSQCRLLYPEKVREKLLVITTARLAKQKGIEHLIAAFRNSNVSAKWAAVIFGEGEEHQRLESQVADAGLRNHVYFMGAVSDVLPYLQGADAFCLPSLYEGMSNSLLEAMACGLPVLATRVSGTVDIVENEKDALLVDPAAPDQLAEGLQRLEDFRLRANLGEAARQKVVQTCGLRHIARRYIALYREMIAGS